MVGSWPKFALILTDFEPMPQTGKRRPLTSVKAVPRILVSIHVPRLRSVRQTQMLPVFGEVDGLAGKIYSTPDDITNTPFLCIRFTNISIT